MRNNPVQSTKINNSLLLKYFTMTPHQQTLANLCTIVKYNIMNLEVHGLFSTVEEQVDTLLQAFDPADLTGEYVVLWYGLLSHLHLLVSSGNTVSEVVSGYVKLFMEGECQGAFLKRMKEDFKRIQSLAIQSR